MVKILNLNDINYYCPTVVLTSVELDCSSITESEFIDIIKKYLTKANKEYKDLVIPKYREFITEQYANNLEFSIDKAKTYAENKWKTEKRRNQYIEEVKENIKKDYNNRLAQLENVSIDFFDFDGNCGTVNGINSDCIIEINITDEHLKNCYKALQTTKYFNKAIGLEFKYGANPRTYEYLFRPYIDLILPEEVKKVLVKERENLEKYISSFYNSNNYTGD